LNLLLDFEEGRKQEKYLEMVKPHERHGLDGQVNGTFFMNETFTCAIMSTMKDETLLIELTDKIPHFDKMMKVCVE